MIKRMIWLTAAVLLCTACSKSDLEKVVTPPDVVGGGSSSIGLPTGGASSSDAASSLNDWENISSSAAAQSSRAASSETANAGASSSSLMTASSQAASSASSAAAVSSESASSEPATASPDGAQLFGDMCSRCHNLQDHLPFQIGYNLSLNELNEIINNTMPFNNSAQCTGECAATLAYFIEASRQP